jgi:diguanylate cyclase (GGDEF)-like protein
MRLLNRVRSAREARLSRMDADRALMSRAFMWAFLVGAVIGLLGSLAFPTHDEVVAGTLGIATVDLAVAAVLFIVPHRIPLWGYHLLLALGTVVVTLAIYFSGDKQGDDEMFYLWVSLTAFYFFPRRQAFAHMALVAVGYAAVVAMQADDMAQDGLRWLTTVGTLTVIGLFVGMITAASRRAFRRLQETARTDDLTGLLNRKGFHEEFAGELARVDRSGGTFALMLGDLDRFKEVNDRLGHLAGDAALERVGEVLHESSRTADRPARIGGEEFAVIMPDADAAAALQAADRLRERVRGAFAGEPVPLTVSFGVSTYPLDGVTEDELLRAADRALYAAKAAGRDRTLSAAG